jgi:hypothetical protein
MWTSNDFAALDQVTTGQMRTIYRSEQRQASLPANASRMAFQLTGLSITVPCHTSCPRCIGRKLRYAARATPFMCRTRASAASSSSRPFES